MKFWDREKEKKWLKRYLMSEPNSILFVYGPKSSGKTTLLMKIIDEIEKEKYQIYWFDLRERLVSGYKDVIEIFFSDEEAEEEMREEDKGIEIGIMSFFKVTMKKKRLIEERRIDPFIYMRKEMEKDKEKGKRPIIIFDEIQKLKEVYLNSPNNQRPLIKELFNFFVRLTKVLHLSHVLVMTSDTFFIETVYSDSTLVNTSRYYLVDYFDEETTIEILKSEGIEEKKAKKIYEEIGGVPWLLEEVLESEDIEETIKEMYLQSKSKILNYIDEKRIKGEDEKVSIRVMKEIMGGRIPEDKEGLKEVREMVEREILFYEPIRREIKYQTKLDEKAAKEIIKEQNGN